jgi:hypothetical protein
MQKFTSQLSSAEKIKILEGNIARYEARMASAVNTDELRRAIKACRLQIDTLKS